jgi:DNA-binding NarL/FixJ family response regulator
MLPLVIRRVLEGRSIKEIAFETGMTPSAVQKIISNTMRKEYVTEAEFRQLLNQRKSTP